MMILKIFLSFYCMFVAYLMWLIGKEAYVWWVITKEARAGRMHEYGLMKIFNIDMENARRMLLRATPKKHRMRLVEEKEKA